MNEYWYLCGNDGVIKYAGKFKDFDECDEQLNRLGEYAVWIFSGRPQIEEAK